MTKIENNIVQHRIVTYIHMHSYKRRMSQMVVISEVNGFLSLFLILLALSFATRLFIIQFV